MAARTGFPGLPNEGGTPRQVAEVFNQMLRRQSSFTMFGGGVSNIGNTSGTTGSFHGPLIPAGGNNITLSQSTNTAGATYTISGPNMMQAGISTQGNTAGTTGFVTQQMLFVGSNLTLSQSVNAGSATLTISAGAAGGFSGGVSNLGNTAGSTGVTGTRLVFVGTNNISLSQSTDANGGTISISGGAGGGGAFSGGVSNLGNTAGSTGVTGTRLVLVGTNGISLSQSTDANGGTVSFNFTQSVQTQNLIAVTLAGNTSGALALISSGTMTLAGGANVTLSQAGNAVTISAAAGGGGGGATHSFWEPFPYVGNNTALSALGNGSIQFVHAALWQNYSGTRGNIYASMTYSTITNNSTRTASISVFMGIYTRNVSTLSLASSGSALHSRTFSSNASTASFTGLKRLSVPITLNMTPGDYWIGVMTRSSGSNASFTGSVLQHAGIAAFAGDLGVATNATHQLFLGHGVWSASSSVLPASVAFTAITGSNATTQRYPFVNFQNFIV